MRPGTLPAIRPMRPPPPAPGAAGATPATLPKIPPMPVRPAVDPVGNVVPAGSPLVPLIARPIPPITPLKSGLFPTVWKPGPTPCGKAWFASFAMRPVMVLSHDIRVLLWSYARHIGGHSRRDWLRDHVGLLLVQRLRIRISARDIFEDAEVTARVLELLHRFTVGHDAAVLTHRRDQRLALRRADADRAHGRDRPIRIPHTRPMLEIDVARDDHPRGDIGLPELQDLIEAVHRSTHAVTGGRPFDCCCAFVGVWGAPGPQIGRASC